MSLLGSMCGALSQVPACTIPYVRRRAATGVLPGKMTVAPTQEICQRDSPFEREILKMPDRRIYQLTR